MPYQALTRRGFFHRMSGGVAGAALTYLLGQDRGVRLLAADDSANAPSDLKPHASQFPAKAKAVIHLFLNGGPSQMDLFDPKPMLDKHHGEAYFD